jgi:transposase
MSAHMPSDRSFQLLEVVPSRMESTPAVARRNWPDNTKARIVEEALAPDVNVSAVARRYGISPSQLFGWRRKAVAKGQVKRRDAPDEDAEPQVASSRLASVVPRSVLALRSARIIFVVSFELSGPHDPLRCEGVPGQSAGGLPERS